MAQCTATDRAAFTIDRRSGKSQLCVQRAPEKCFPSCGPGGPGSGSAPGQQSTFHWKPVCSQGVLPLKSIEQVFSTGTGTQSAIVRRLALLAGDKRVLAKASVKKGAVPDALFLQLHLSQPCRCPSNTSRECLFRSAFGGIAHLMSCRGILVRSEVPGVASSGSGIAWGVVRGWQRMQQLQHPASRLEQLSTLLYSCWASGCCWQVRWNPSENYHA